jgi:hypothetical protein
MRRAVNLARKRAMARGELNAVLVFGFVAALCLFVALARVTGPVSMLSKRAHEQQLWNAASNDVITKYNVGKPHAYGQCGRCFVPSEPIVSLACILMAIQH